VTGAHENLIKPLVFNHSNVRIVHNKDYKFGQTSSFQQGILSCDDQSNGFMLLPVDCPFITTQTINTLIEYFQQKNPSILVPTLMGKRGHPPIFHSNLKKTILNLNIHQGINDFMREQIVTTLEISDPGVVQSFNTQEELNKLVTGTIN
jgi:CTP:molybdopterin cytidylyltransferase MocA